MEMDPDLKRLVKNYFTYSLREYKASLLFITVFVFLYFLPDIEMLLFPREYNESLLNEKVHFLDSLTRGGTYRESAAYREEPVDSAVPLQPCIFDPNTADEPLLTNAGFTSRQIRSLLNYRSKGGRFYTKEDVKKLYGLTPQQYARMEPWISIAPKDAITTPASSVLLHETRPGKSMVRVEINAADTLQLETLPYIGFGLARRIVKYREALGGFISLKQLCEVYGIRSTLTDSLMPYLTLDASQVRKIRINEEDIEVLKKHPYIKYRLASALVNYRKQHGPFQSAGDLRKVILMDEATLEKLAPYLSF